MEDQRVKLPEVTIATEQIQLIGDSSELFSIDIERNDKVYIVAKAEQI